MAITLSEKLALLAFNDEKGVPYDRAETALPHALAATLVLDLQAAGAVELGGSRLARRSQNVVVHGSARRGALHIA